MLVKHTKYEINGLNIEWGKPLNEVAPLLEKFEKFQPYEGWANIRCRCFHIFGLAATECEIRAPFADRPVLQVQYELSPLKPGFLQQLHSPFISQLKKTLGNPVEVQSLYRQNRLPQKYVSGAVVYSAKWLFKDIRISLSLYGGTRHKDSGETAAGIFIDWINEKEAAEPFQENAKKFETFIMANMSEITTIKKFNLLHDQRPFRVVHFELSDPYIAEKDPTLRAAQMALYKRELYQTPLPIQNMLKINEIAIYALPGLKMTFVSTKWDTVCLTSKDDHQVTYYEVLPARGPGGRKIEIKELLIDDSKESNTLLELKKEIESKVGLIVDFKESYDD